MANNANKLQPCYLRRWNVTAQAVGPQGFLVVSWGQRSKVAPLLQEVRFDQIMATEFIARGFSCVSEDCRFSPSCRFVPRGSPLSERCSFILRACLPSSSSAPSSISLIGSARSQHLSARLRLVVLRYRQRVAHLEMSVLVSGGM